MPDIKIPTGLTLRELQDAFRSIDEILRETGFTGVGDINLRGRRIINAGNAQDDTQYVTRADLEKAKAEIRILQSRVKSVATTGTTPASTTGLQGAMDFGYYLPDVPGSFPFGDFFDSQADYTNIYHCWLGRGYSSDSNEAATPSTWLVRIAPSLQRAAQAGKKIHLLFDVDGVGNPWVQRIGSSSVNLVTLLDTLLDIAAPYWDKVSALTLSDEGITDAGVASTVATTLRTRLAAKALADRPIGTILTQEDTLRSEVVRSSNLNFIGVEAYVEPASGLGSREANTGYVRDFLQNAYNAISPDKKISITMQAYARNGAWTDIPALVQLQMDIYDLVKTNTPRVFELLMFSLGRASGTKQLTALYPTAPTMVAMHRQISAKIFTGAVSPTPVDPGAPGTPTPPPPGSPCGGNDLPEGCTRYCSGGQLAQFFVAAQDYVIANNPAFFVPASNPIVIVAAQAANYVSAIVARLNDPAADGGVVMAKVQPTDGREVLVQRRTNPGYLEIYGSYAGDLTIRRVPGAYIGTCVPAFT